MFVTEIWSGALYKVLFLKQIEMTLQGWHDIYQRYISDIFKFENIGYFRYFQNWIFSIFFNITLLRDVKTSLMGTSLFKKCLKPPYFTVPKDLELSVSCILYKLHNFFAAFGR